MATSEYYFASFNVGNVEVWSTELYLDKESVFYEIEKSKDEIAERIDDFSIFVGKKEINKVLEYTISDLKKCGMYRDKENDFDFFILEKSVLEKYEQKVK